MQDEQLIRGLIKDLDESYDELKTVFGSKTGDESRALLIDIPIIKETGRRLVDRIDFYKNQRVTLLLGTLNASELLIELADSPTADEFPELHRIPTFMANNEMIRASHMKVEKELINALIEVCDVLEDYIQAVKEAGLKVKEINETNRIEHREHNKKEKRVEKDIQAKLTDEQVNKLLNEILKYKQIKEGNSDDKLIELKFKRVEIVNIVGSDKDRLVKLTEIFEKHTGDKLRGEE